MGGARGSGKANHPNARRGVGFLPRTVYPPECQELYPNAGGIVGDVLPGAVDDALDLVGHEEVHVLPWERDGRVSRAVVATEGRHSRVRAGCGGVRALARALSERADCRCRRVYIGGELAPHEEPVHDLSHKSHGALSKRGARLLPQEGKGRCARCAPPPAVRSSCPRGRGGGWVA